MSSVVGRRRNLRRASCVVRNSLSSASKITLLCALIAFGTCLGQAPAHSSTDAEQHIRDVINELPTASPLRKELVNGARGDGVRHPWMDEMRVEEIKSAMVWVDIKFNHAGKPVHMKIAQIRCYSGYDQGGLITDLRKLNVIRSSGLEKQLTDLALRQAANGSWVDVPRPKPQPFVGGMRVQFFDDEWLPNAGALYCAGKACAGE